MRLRVILLTAFATICFAAIALGVKPYNSSGGWACFSGSCVIGHERAPSIALTTDSGTVTVDGAVTIPGALSVAGASTLTGAVTLAGAVTTAADITISADATGGDAGVVNQFIGVPRIRLVASATDETIDATVVAAAWMDDTPDGECAPVVDGDETANETTIYRVGAESYHYTWDAAAADNDGLDCDIATGPSGNGVDSLGFWLRSSVAFASGDLDATLIDTAAVEGNAVIPAYTTPNVWQWMEVDFATDCDATCAAVDGVLILATAQAPTTFNGAELYIDTGGMWDVTAEVDLNLSIQYDGVLGVVASPDAEAGEQDFTVLVEGTSYLVHYEDGADFLVALDNQSANTWMILVAY